MSAVSRTANAAATSPVASKAVASTVKATCSPRREARAAIQRARGIEPREGRSRVALPNVVVRLVRVAVPLELHVPKRPGEATLLAMSFAGAAEVAEILATSPRLPDARAITSLSFVTRAVSIAFSRNRVASTNSPSSFVMSPSTLYALADCSTVAARA